MNWIPPWIAPNHCAACIDGWVERTPCYRLIREQHGQRIYEQMIAQWRALKRAA